MKPSLLKTINQITVITGISIFLSGCLSTPEKQYTPEEEAQITQMREAFIQRMKAGTDKLRKSNANVNKTTSFTQKPVTSKLNFEELIAKAKAVTETGGPATFKVERDGISINDEVYLDSEGTVERAGWDMMTGHFTYTIANFDGSRILKFHRAGSISPPINIATIKKNNQGYRVETMDGQTLAGQAFIPTSNGLIVSRGSSIFEYKIGQKLNSVVTPKGWNVAKFQKGDVASSGLILLERDKQSKNQQKSFMSGFNEIGRSFGLTEIYDYALYDLKNKKSVLLNMSLNDKQVTVMKNCVKKNSLVNECSDADTYDSLYEKNGSRNRLHYYWSLDWFNTPAGPMAVYNSGKKLIAIDINAGINMTLLERAMGINHFALEQDTTGNVNIITQLGFQKNTIPNLSEYIATELIDVEPTKSL